MVYLEMNFGIVIYGRDLFNNATNIKALFVYSF